MTPARHHFTRWMHDHVARLFERGDSWTVAYTKALNIWTTTMPIPPEPKPHQTRAKHWKARKRPQIDAVPIPDSVRNAWPKRNTSQGQALAGALDKRGRNNRDVLPKTGRDL